MMSDVDDNDND